MANDIDANEYFLSQRPDSGPLRLIYSRIAKAIYFYGGVTMNQLCEMSDKELKMVRGIGNKARAVIAQECKNYLKGISQGDIAD